MTPSLSAPHLRLAEALAFLRGLQQNGQHVFRSSELSRMHRERLLRAGFLQEVMKGWLIPANPGTRPGDSTPWYASFWDFCARYCEERFGAEWHLSPEQSLLIHGENTVIPAQVIVSSPKAANNKVDLPFGTSLYDLKVQRMPAPGALMTRAGLRLFTPESSLVRVAEGFLARHPIETRVVLMGIRDSAELIRELIEGNHPVVAGRLAATFRRENRASIADQIIDTMRSAGFEAREPGRQNLLVSKVAAPPSEPPVAGRVRALWNSMRGRVIELFPKPPGVPKDMKGYVRFIEVISPSDAYHSLSIEGYTVTPELIERVRSGKWDPRISEADRQNRDALAARGYWQTFQAVKRDVFTVLGGANPGSVVRDKHREWYREMFQPCVTAGLIPPGALAGYRNNAVYLRTSRYVPPRWEAVRDAMPALFDLLESETDAGVRAVLGHWMFGYIHPYPDGNGRMARFLMNLMLAAGGYPWTVIRFEDRDEYLSALDSASIDSDIAPFTRLIARRAVWPETEFGKKKSGGGGGSRTRVRESSR